MFLSKKSNVLLLLSIFCAISTATAQSHNPLINSGEKLKEGARHYQNKKYKDALNSYNQINKSDTNYAIALAEIANALYYDSQFVKSAEMAQLGIAMFPEKISSFSMQVANAMDNMGKPAEAQAYYDSAIKINPHNYLLYFNKAITNYNQSAYPEAKKYFQQCLMINPFYSNAHFFLGATYMKEGNLVPAMLSLCTYLMITPDGKYKANAIQSLSDISKSSDDVLVYVKNKNANNEKSFTAIQDILLSKIAMDPKYKSMVDIDDPMIKQIQVVCEKLEYRKDDKGFPMQFYVPLFTKVFSDKDFDAMIFTMFSDVDIKAIKNWLKKNKKSTTAFTNTAYNYLNEVRMTRVLDQAERAKNKLNYIYSENVLTARGQYEENNKQFTPLGKWEFYNDEGGLKLEGNFNREGKRDGVWSSYYPSGKPKEKLAYKNGKQEGLSEGWFENGNKWYEETYVNNKLDGIQRINFFNEHRKTEFIFKDDKKNGEQKYYNFKGELIYTYNYVNDKLDGAAKTYYDNGKIKDISAYKNDIENSNYKSYYQNGQISYTGTVTDGKRDGLWTGYYEDGSIKSKTTYKSGDVTGEFTEYYQNGKPSMTGTYVKKKLDGKSSYFDDDGKLYCEATYDRGRLKEISFTDKKGNVYANTTTRKGAATITFYSANGKKNSEGFFDKEGLKQGKHQDFYANGKISKETNWKDGELNGTYITYSGDGQKLYESKYVNGKEDGYATSYYVNGNKKSEGWVVNDSKQQTWMWYKVNGQLYLTEYYLDDNLNGYLQYYYGDNKLDYEMKYRNGWLMGVVQFDTSGKVLHANKFERGDGTLIYKHFNGKILSESKQKNYMSDGEKKVYYFDGSVSSITNFVKDKKQGAYISYHYGGKKSAEGNYVDNKKDGTWKYYYPDGQLNIEESFKAGKQDGMYTKYARDGRLEKTVMYKDDELHGPYTYYGANKEKAVVLNYEEDRIISYQYEDKDGKLVSPIPIKFYSGEVKAFYPNGKPSATFNFVENVIRGEYAFYYSNGNLMSTGKMTQGYLDGPQKSNFSNGKAYKEENYILGELYGKRVIYYPDGKIAQEENFYDDDQHGINTYYDKNGKPSVRNYYYGFILNVK